MEPVEISAGRLHLRPWAAHDEDALVRAMSDPLIERWTPVPVPFTRQEARRRLTEVYPQLWESGAGAPFAVLDATSGEVLAWVSLFDVRDGAAEIGWSCAPDARGAGVTTEAVAALCRWGFQSLGLQVLGAVIAVGNWPSRAVAEKCGFQVDGLRRRLMAQRGDRLDAWTATLLATDEMVDRRPLPAPPVLSDGVVTLRAFRADDAPDVQRACDDPVSARWLPMPSPYRLEDAVSYVEQTCPTGWAEGTSATFAVTDAGTGELLGDISLKLGERSFGVGEVGYWTAPWARGRGAAGRATALLTEWGLASLGLNRVELQVDVENTASLRAAEKAGFTLEGVARQARPDRHGVPHDMRVLSRVRSGGAPPG